MKYDDWKLDSPDYLESEDEEQQLEDGLHDEYEDSVIEEDEHTSFLDNMDDWEDLDDDRDDELLDNE